LRKNLRNDDVYYFFNRQLEVKRTTRQPGFTDIFDLGERDLTQGCFATLDERRAPVGSASTSVSRFLGILYLFPAFQKRSYKSIISFSSLRHKKKKTDLITLLLYSVEENLFANQT